MSGKVVAAAIVGIVVLGIIMGVSFGAAIMGFYNNAVKMENGIKAQYEQNKNNYDNYFKKLKETAQVPEMYTDDMRKIYGEVITGRYGSQGSRAMFQWIKEHNPSLDAALYKKVQDVIESGRNSFGADQKMLLDKKLQYDNYRQTFPNNVIAGFLGFPKINLDEYAIVTSEETEDAFKTKKSEPLKLR